MNAHPIVLAGLLASTTCSTTPTGGPANGQAGEQSGPAKVLANQWGSYSGPIRVEFLRPRNMMVHEAVSYTDPTGRKWVANKGDEFNGASIPQAVWSVIGGPFDDAYRDASLFHDLAYDRRTSTWQDADRMFYYSMRCSGVAEWKAKVMFSAVWKYSKKWPNPRTSGDRIFSHRPRLPQQTLPSPEPAEEDIRALRSWIGSADPTLEEIEMTLTPVSEATPSLEQLNERLNSIRRSPQR